MEGPHPQSYKQKPIIWQEDGMKMKEIGPRGVPSDPGSANDNTNGYQQNL